MASVLIVGGEGRAHALGWKLAQSPLVEQIYFAPGNGGTGAVGENLPIEVNDLSGLLKFAKKTKIDLTVVSPEQPLVDGIVDLFEAAGLPIFGPSAKAAMIEGSKVFSADFMLRHNIPHPASTPVSTLAEAKDYIKNRSPKDYVIKADGLAAGKGVIVPKAQAEAETALIKIMQKSILGEAGRQIVFQERLRGQEVSAFALSDGQKIIMLPFVQDHKQVFDGDRGPNTGGMGAYGPLPFMTSQLAERIKTEIMQPAIDGMRADGTPYRGLLYGGLFITEVGEPKAIEFNCRFGDPECQVLMMLVDEDLYPILMGCAQGNLTKDSIKLKTGSAAIVCLASKGYPGTAETGYEVKGLDKIKDPNVMIFHAGDKKENGKVITSAGRVLGVTAYGKDLKGALSKAYAQIGPKGIHFEHMHFRKDIGFRVLG
ncbi:TPA: phosphoribosylamine--glycine ligase [Candidatus Saccharibacteria bacterium]|nr:MAG: Phosphoribosylamine-glycine ligase [Candidatus Saccharibacteria bacterium GW2011_GWA2_46_10]OGL36134.1 MAG: phosphoribosylamine--glycine ligase [Candidatus Saccharibacteria bacterium RIFCSPHIGHO2_12_FULL_47_17]HCM52152.1 phosphoribosylamine--glycine ligase [Candidatus Saccharibacteria bacterium]